MKDITRENLIKAIMKVKACGLPEAVKLEKKMTDEECDQIIEKYHRWYGQFR